VDCITLTSEEEADGTEELSWVKHKIADLYDPIKKTDQEAARIEKIMTNLPRLAKGKSIIEITDRPVDLMRMSNEGGGGGLNYHSCMTFPRAWNDGSQDIA
jgi:hypothetical protein